MGPIKAVILIGGPSRGTRFRPLSFYTPKPLFPIAGEPMIYHHIKACAKIPELKEVLLIGFYEPEMFAQFMEQTEKSLGIKVKYLREHKALGTAGGLYHFRDEILSGNPEFLFVLHADVYGEFYLPQLLESHKRHRSNAHSTILGKKVAADLANNFGVIVKGDDDTVLHYAEKPETFVSDIINCGVYLFSPTIFEQLGRAHTKNQTRMDDRDPDAISLESDLLAPLAARNEVYVYLSDAAWGQVKSAGSALPANTMYLALYRQHDPSRLASSSPLIAGNVFVHPSAQVHPTAKLGPNVSIGANVQIGPGARVRDAIVLDDTQIKAHACVINAVIGQKCSIGRWSRVEGGADAAPAFEQFVRSKKGQKTLVTIFGDDVVVSDETVVRHCIVLPHKELKSNSIDEIIM